MRFETKIILGLCLVAILGITSCKKEEGCTDVAANNYNADAEKDDGSCTYDDDGYTVPATYNFENVSYSGQTDRLDMMAEMTTYMKTGNTMGTTLDAQKLKDMFANTNSQFSDPDLNSSTKQLKDKCFSLDQDMFEEYIDSIAASSQSTVAGSNGVAGVVSNGTKSYLCAANGFEYTQLIEKGLMGAVFYYQIAEVYTRDEKIGNAVDNETITTGEGTDMEHHWDEAFGYFGVPIDFPTNTTGIRFYGNYSNGRDALLGTNSLIMDAFLEGRTAISNKDYTQRDASAEEVRVNLEKVIAATAIHYLNAGKANISDDALRNHELSEAIAFVGALKYNTDALISSTEIQSVLDHIGDNLYEVTATDLDNARNELSTIYSLDSVKDAL